jgi:membrane-associated phospholipid phosphatase
MNKISALIFVLFFPLCLSAQELDTVQQQKKLGIKPFIIPAALVGYGFVAKGDNFINDFDKSIQRRLHTNNPNPSERAEDILRYTPAAMVYGLHLAGIKGRNNLIDASGVYVLSTIIMGVSVKTTKSLSNHIRPDGSDENSFPSGHSSTAFASAEFLRQEYRDVSPWYGYAGYTVAAATGVLRLRNNKHWFGDVVAGAGFGILSTKAAYLLYPEVKKLFKGKHTSSYTILPAYQQNRIGLNFNATF